ncbi:hypothetical protein V5P93_002496 [Actinokineospora auranticolor]|uniref:Uncharacterized protein n=1 Tax=Actinokineospora auranticolor TaxID=155976 RepID=A0A2S6GMS2_9PSEU|nr:hypothetical protein [Actinokineospora auranticolor]PPK66473.1 hypothetical protein CLV40_110177 [Actinokineospora auranticolor]
MSTADQWHVAWAAALDRLEADVDSAEALLNDEHMLRELPKFDPWNPPQGLGPLPIDLRPRADAVLRRQLEVASKVAAAMTSAAMHTLVLGKMSGDAKDPARPSYVDVAL